MVPENKRLQIFQESDLAFSFNRHWLVRHYDKHTYFQGLSGAGLKGVDFLGIFKRQHLVLMEVKNYRHDSKGLRKAHIRSSLENPEAVAYSIADKMLDTLRAINLIGQYFETRPTYRLFKPILPWTQGLTPEWHFWTLARQLADSQVSMICWMALEQDHLPVAPLIQDLANRKIGRANFRVNVLGVEENPFAPDLQIQV